jgi:hypothetical protein
VLRANSFWLLLCCTPPHFLNFLPLLACSLLFLFFSLFLSCSLPGLHSRGVALPEPSEILGNLVDKEGEDPDGAPCLRETDAHADFLFHFAKTVIVYCTFNSSSTTMLLSEYMAKCLEAYAVITYVNSYDAWMEEATRREEGRNEDSDSPSSAGSRKRRRFTEKSKGSGKFKGWDKSGIRLYNKINKMLDKQRSDESLVEFDKKMKTWFLVKGKNSSPSSQNDDDEYDSEDGVATNNFICKRRAMEAARGGQWKRWASKSSNKLKFRLGSRMN